MGLFLIMERKYYDWIVTSLYQSFYIFHFTRDQFWPSVIVVACVCLCVRLCVRQSRACPRDNLSPVQARITKFGP